VALPEEASQEPLEENRILTPGCGNAILSTVKRSSPPTTREHPGVTLHLDADAVLSPFKEDAWRRLTPGQRLVRAWKLREQLRNPRDVHDRKLFPAP